MTRCPSFVVTAIGDWRADTPVCVTPAEGIGVGTTTARGAAGSSAGCPQPAISSTAATTASAKDFHIALRFLFMVEVFDDCGLRARTERAKSIVVHRRGGHDRAAAIVGIAGGETNRVLAVDEEVGHAPCIRGQ